MYIVGVDPSLSSTAVSIYNDGILTVYNFNNKKANYKWYKATNSFIDYTHHQYVIGKNFSDSEIVKLTIFDEVTDAIVNKIDMERNGEHVKCYIEGYSYSSTGKIIDLVTFSTLLRYKLLEMDNTELTIIPPSSLKKYIGKQVYPFKSGSYRNETGKAAGSFDKKDMMNALLKLDLEYPYINYLDNHSEELLAAKNIPKPFDDVNDAVILMHYGCTENDIDI